MAKTSVVNRRKKRRRNSGGPKRRRNARRYGAAARTANPRRRSSRRRSSRRRRNPSSPFNYQARTKNPSADMFSMDALTDVMPAATLGVFAVRWAMKIAGPLDVIDQQSGEVTTKVGVPGLKHAVAGVIAANFAEDLVSQVFGGDARRGEYARIAGLGFVGDLYARTRIFNDSKWVNENLLLQGLETSAPLAGLQESSALAGPTPGYQLVADNDGNVYEIPEGYEVVDEQAAAPQQLSGPRRRSTMSSFGYR